MSETAEKAIRVLELLSTHDAPVRLVDLSRGLKMNKSTTYRLAEKLRQLGYVRQDDETGRYMLTVRMWEVGVRAFRRFDMRYWAKPYLEEIHRKTNETAVLAILDGRDVVIVDKIDSAQAVQTFSPLGSRSPLHCSSLGKAFLMTNLEGLLAGMTEPLEAFTPHTFTSLAKLRLNIAAGQREGVATAFNEFREGVSGVSAPVVGVEGVALGVVGVTLPTARAAGPRLADAKAAVRQATMDLSRALGRAEG